MSVKDFIKAHSAESKVEEKEKAPQNVHPEQEKRIDFEPITAYDTQKVQGHYSVNPNSILGENFKTSKLKSPVNFPPAIIVDYNSKKDVKPEPIQEEVKEPDEAELKKQAYRENTVTAKDLREKTKRVIKNTNKQDVKRRFIFALELEACKNGFWYYLIPFILGIVLLVVNFFQHNFFVNMFVSLLVLLTGISIRAIFRRLSVWRLLLNLILIILYGASFVLAVKYVPNFLDEIHLPITVKLFLIVYDIYCCGKFYAFFAITYAQDCKLDFGNSVRLNAGKPRSGKTSNAVHDARILAMKFWEKLQFDFWDWHSREKEIYKRNDLNELLEYQEIRVSYLFYIEKKCIPCLFSNIGIQDRNGNRCHRVDIDHIRGVRRLPLYTVVVLDEIGAVLKAELANDKEGRPYDVSDMFRLGGHYLKWCVIACEQDYNNVYIDCRRVVGFNQLISGQEWVCRPTILWGIYNMLKFFISSSMHKKQKRKRGLAHFMHWFERYVRSIGFRRFRYQNVSNTQTKASINGVNEEQKSFIIEGKGVRYVPSRLCADYSDRAYKQLYPSYFDKKIIAELHPALYISGTDTKYSRQFVNTSKAIEEKRAAIDECVKDIA